MRKLYQKNTAWVCNGNEEIKISQNKTVESKTQLVTSAEHFAPQNPS